MSALARLDADAGESDVFDRRAGASLTRRVGQAAALMWLIFLAFPLLDAFAQPRSATAIALILLGTVAFVSDYVLLVLVHDRGFRMTAAGVGLLLAIAVAMTVGESAGWGGLFIYTAAAAAFTLGRRAAFGAVAVCTLFAAGTALEGAALATVITFTVMTPGIGLLQVMFVSMRRRNQELVDARHELARLAVADERLRFARDVHDLLGHSLTVIALKAELAGRLLPADPVGAARHVGELEAVARQALSEVREAASGYREPQLESELAGARLALDAAHIDAVIGEPAVALNPEIEALLAWAVREGTTNVIRHSGSRNCRISFTAGPTDASIEISDDGQTSEDGHARRAGSGLIGLRERAAALAGRVEAGPEPGGGFVLRVTVPRSRVRPAAGGAR